MDNSPYRATCAKCGAPAPPSVKRHLQPVKPKGKGKGRGQAALAGKPKSEDDGKARELQAENARLRQKLEALAAAAAAPQPTPAAAPTADQDGNSALKDKATKLRAAIAALAQSAEFEPEGSPVHALLAQRRKELENVEAERRAGRPLPDQLANTQALVERAKKRKEKAADAHLQLGKELTELKVQFAQAEEALKEATAEEARAEQALAELHQLAGKSVPEAAAVVDLAGLYRVS